MRLAIVLGVVSSIAGCGLVLDYDPPDPVGVDASGMDAGGDERDGGIDRDGAAADAPECTIDPDCDDEDPCNGAEICTPAGCAPGEAPSCDDAIDCTTDSCLDGSCLHEPTDAACDLAPGGRCDVELGGCQYDVCDEETCVPPPCGDAHCEGTTCVRGILCAAGEICCEGACAPAGCSDGEECTDDACEAGTGCVHRPAPSRFCGPTLRCEGRGVCVDGDCDPGEPIACPDDTNPCTVPVCTEAAGCAFAPAPDGTACTVAVDRCVATAACSGGACIATSRIACPPEEPCATWACDSAAGACSRRPRPVGTMCDDGNACTFGDDCDGVGGCSGTPVMCVDDPSPCRTSVCDPTSGCVPRNAPDGTACGPTGAQVCVAGACSCPMGTADCNLDGTCECDLSRLACSGGLCTTGGTVTCADLVCAGTTPCCECKGVPAACRRPADCPC